MSDPYSATLILNEWFGADICKPEQVLIEESTQFKYISGIAPFERKMQIRLFQSFSKFDKKIEFENFSHLL